MFIWKNIFYVLELELMKGKDVKFFGYRRFASVSVDIGSWNILVNEDKFIYDFFNGWVE